MTRQLSRLLVIPSAGYIEAGVAVCIRSYLQSKAHPSVASFGATWLKGGRNPSHGNLVDILQRFNNEWASQFDVLLSANDGRLKRELSFLVERRNQIAHGSSEGINQSKAVELSEIAGSIVDWFAKTLDPR